MRIIAQRVIEASVVVDHKTVGSIQKGILALVGFGQEDSEAVIDPMLNKLVNLRIFENEQGRFDKSLLDINGELLLVPQFTLYADLKKGRRPDFLKALDPKMATAYFDQTVIKAGSLGLKNIGTGIFGADMKVSLINDGPVTITIDSELL